jgi:uncharacterized protein (TIGR02147 family)
MAMKNIFEYTNYREYLKDFFEESKKKNPAFTHRYLSKSLGLSTPNLVWLVMRGKRNMTLDLCKKLGIFLKHTIREQRYFKTMALFQNSKDHEERNEYFSEMLKLRHIFKIKNIEDEQFQYFSNWYNLVIRELVTYPDFKGNYADLGKMVSPPVSEPQARESVKLLLRLGMIKKKAGRYVQTEPLIGTAPEVKSTAIVNYHRTMAGLAASSYDRSEPDEHNITAVTLSMTKEKFVQLTRETTDYRKRVMALAQDGSKKTKVYQVNIQIFPVSKPPKKWLPPPKPRTPKWSIRNLRPPKAKRK